MQKTPRQLHLECHRDMLNMARRALPLDRAMAFQMLAQAAVIRRRIAHSPR